MIKFEYENWVVITSSVDSPLYKVADIYYDIDTTIGVRKSSIEDIIKTTKQGIEPEHLAILIASIRLRREKSSSNRNLAFKPLPENIIISGLKEIFKSTRYDCDSLLSLFEEFRPDQVAEILRSPNPIDVINELA